MQSTANFHHHIAYAVFPHPNSLLEHTAAFDTAIDMFDTHPALSDRPVVRFLCGRQRFSARFPRRLKDRHARQGEALKAHVLQQLTAFRQRIRGCIGDALVMDTARMRLTQEHDAQRGIDEEQVFQHMPLFLAAITRFLCSRVCGARNGSLSAVMTKRGAAAGVAAWSTADEAASQGSSASASPRWWRNASTLRHGASPKVRKAFRNTGSKT